MFYRNRVAIGAGVVVYGVSTYLSFCVYSIFKLPRIADIHDPKVQAKYEKSLLDPCANKNLDFDEWFMGIAKLRRKLIQKADGKILEIASGTGRNSSYYHNKDLVVLSDINLDMLRESAKVSKDPMFRFLQFDCCNDSVTANSQFDTVVDTFGLCSVDDPVKCLQNMYKYVKPGGKLLLLEHGRLHNSYFDYILDKTSIRHASNWGCWWNRDICALITEAGIPIKNVKTYWFGHFIEIECEKKL